MVEQQGYMKALCCRECGEEYPLEARHVCELCFGPLEVVYDYEAAKRKMTRQTIEDVLKACGDTPNYCRWLVNQPLAARWASHRW